MKDILRIFYSFDKEYQIINDAHKSIEKIYKEALDLGFKKDYLDQVYSEYKQEQQTNNNKNKNL
jgi:hypothetical protein